MPLIVADNCIQIAVPLKHSKDTYLFNCDVANAGAVTIEISSSGSRLRKAADLDHDQENTGTIKREEQNVLEQSNKAHIQRETKKRPRKDIEDEIENEEPPSFPPATYPATLLAIDAEVAAINAEHTAAMAALASGSATGATTTNLKENQAQTKKQPYKYEKPVSLRSRL